MKQDKTRNSKKSAPADDSSEPGVFCTQCGATLENFCFSSAADDLEAVRKTLAQCREQGRFSGEFCSKLFIAHPEAASEPPETLPGDPDDEADDNLA